MHTQDTNVLTRGRLHNAPSTLCVGSNSSCVMVFAVCVLSAVFMQIDKYLSAQGQSVKRMSLDTQQQASAAADGGGGVEQQQQQQLTAQDFAGWSKVRDCIEGKGGSKRGGGGGGCKHVLREARGHRAPCI